MFNAYSHAMVHQSNSLNTGMVYQYEFFAIMDSLAQCSVCGFVRPSGRKQLPTPPAVSPEKILLHFPHQAMSTTTPGSLQEAKTVTMNGRSTRQRH